MKIPYDTDKESAPHCPVCGSSRLEVFFEMTDAPIFCTLLWPDRDSAMQCPKGDVVLAFCHNCSGITNLAFEPERMYYTQAYENSLHFSSVFQDYAEALAKKLVERYDLHNKDIIEIGCGKGDFLFMLCELGGNRGIGFDPSYVERKEFNKAKADVRFIQDLYSPAYADYQGDFICCRHTLEHIQDPKGFLGGLRKAIGKRLNVPVFFEVPSALNTFRRFSIWEIIYEHCSYFTPVSLAWVFSSCGFDVSEVTEEYEGLFLCIHALSSENITSSAETDMPALRSLSQQRLGAEVEKIAEDIAMFSANYRDKVEVWQDKLNQMKSKGQRAVLWGAGARGITFLNILKIQDQIEYAVDINPRKEGAYISGTGQQIVMPAFLRDYKPDVIIIVNPVYKDEIQQKARELGLAPEFMYA